MSPDDFLALVLADLRLRHVPFDHRRLQEFFDGMWPLVAPDDQPDRWADAFLEASGSEPGLHELGRAPVERLYEASGN
jgi:hypothetical protein